MIRVAASSTLSRIVAAKARPSVSGMRASSSTSGKGRPLAALCQMASRAASPSPRATGCICHPRSHSSRIWRLVALSSTISTGKLESKTGGLYRERSRGVRLTPEPRRKRKRAAAARFAFHRDGATHQS